MVKRMMDDRVGVNSEGGEVVIVEGKRELWMEERDGQGRDENVWKTGIGLG